MSGECVDRIYLAQEDPVAGCCEHGSESSGWINSGKCIY
jgi:hypothetical protein